MIDGLGEAINVWRRRSQLMARLRFENPMSFFFGFSYSFEQNEKSESDSTRGREKERAGER